MVDETSVLIPPDHPAIPGHFPGDPLVPGVLLLGHVVAALEAERGPIRLRAIPQVKFLAPLRPGETCAIRFPSIGADRAQFECRRGDALVARGSLGFDAGDDPSAAGMDARTSPRTD